MDKRILVLGAILLVLGCTSSSQEPCKSAAKCENPASAYCFEQNKTLEIRIDPLGGEYGVCKFRDGTECEEWRYYRKECDIGQSNVTAPPRVQEYCKTSTEVYLCRNGVVKKVKEGEDLIRFISGRGSEILCQKGPEQMNSMCNDLIAEGFCLTENVC